MWLELERVREQAARHKWVELDHQPAICMISFTKNKVGKVGKVRINIYYSKGTVGTAMRHPKYGHGQLFRRNISHDQLEEIFKNPRVHSSRWGARGYRYRANMR